MWLGLGLSLYTGAKTPVAFSVASLFSSGEQGAWYDPSDFSTLFQDYAGTTPVTAVEQPVGLMLDKRLNLALGADLVDTANTAAAWFSYGTNTVTQDGDAVKTTYVDNSSGANIALSAAGCLSVNLTLNNWYEVRLQAKVNTGSVNFQLLNMGNGSPTVTITSTSYVDVVLRAPKGASTPSLFLNGMGAGEIIWVRNITIKELAGNHAYQATSGARPVLKDISGYKSLFYDGIDDSMTTPAGGGGTAGFMFCVAVKPTGGAGTIRTLWSDTGTNTGYKVQIDAANKLSFSAGNNTTFTTIVTVGTVDVGSTNVVMAWDDGVNLNVQIGSGAVASVARPVVVAGTAAFTLGKDNGTATSFFTGNIYPEVYRQGSGLTSDQRTNVKAYVASKSGVTL